MTSLWRNSLKTRRLTVCSMAMMYLVPVSALAQQAEAPEAPVAERHKGVDIDNRGAPTPWPKPDRGYVTDLGHLLRKSKEEQIERWLWKTEKETGVEIAVVTIKSMNDYPDTGTGTIEQFAAGMFNHYGIGNLPENDGVLLLVSKQDRKARIELGAGYGHRRDRDAERIMQGTIVPAFKKDDYSGGITNGVKQLTLEFAEVRVGLNWPLIMMMGTVPVLGLIAFSLFRNGKRGWGWVCVGLIAVLIFAIFRMMGRVIEDAGDSDSWSSGGYGGGFGGGFSGGGGATGSW